MLSATFVSLFPETVLPFLNSSVLGKAHADGKFAIESINFRDFATGGYKSVDDTPCGGGPGQVIRIDIAALALQKALLGKERKRTRVILMDPAGTPFKTSHAKRLAEFDNLIFLCGRYEGIDSRIYHYVDDALSIGDFVLTSGELAATVVLDAVLRFVPEVLGNSESAVRDSHSDDCLLEHSQYTRPIEFEGHQVPDVLLSGNHKKIQEYRRVEQLRRTAKVRPDLLPIHGIELKDARLLKNALDIEKFPWMQIF